ncbi:MAG: hypothetical protein IT318_19500 [Anaerolineales bacterium]|nr:hypothetical protein [Anaerolineales bacterium]
MNAAILFMHALKETCALHCLLALHIAGPLPVTQRTVMAITGFDDEAVRKGLNKLQALGLAVCSGQRQQTGWQLAPGARQLPLGGIVPAKPELEPALKEEGCEGIEGGEGSEAIKEIEALELTQSSLVGDGEAEKQAALGGTAAGAQAAVEMGLAGGTGRRAGPKPAASRPARGVVNTPPSKSAAKPRPPSGAGAKPRTPGRGAAARPAPETGTPANPADRTLRAQLLTVMARAHVWPNLRLGLADELLAEDGAGWVRQALGWVCYGVRRFPRWDLGAVVYPALRDRLPVDPDYWPPPELEFAAALAWAEAGGEPGPGYANAAQHAPGPPAAEDERPEPGRAAGAAGPQTPEDGLWQQARARLLAEMPGAPLESWLSGARLEARGAGRYRLAVPTPRARDWLSNRLQARLEQALGAAAGEAVELEIVLPADKKTPTEGGQLG